MATNGCIEVLNPTLTQMLYSQCASKRAKPHSPNTIATDLTETVMTIVVAASTKHRPAKLIV